MVYEKVNFTEFQGMCYMYNNGYSCIKGYKLFLYSESDLICNFQIFSDDFIPTHFIWKVVWSHWDRLRYQHLFQSAQQRPLFFCSYLHMPGKQICRFEAQIEIPQENYKCSRTVIMIFTSHLKTSIKNKISRSNLT